MLSIRPSLTKEVLERNKAMNWLLDTFPKAFDLCNRKPLKNNLLEEILSLNKPSQPTKEALTAALNHYTLWASYLGALKEGASCFDLNGNITSTVSLAQEQEAQKILTLSEKKLNTH